MRSRKRRRLRRVAVITGTRAEYGLLRSTMGAIRGHPGLKLRVVAVGMHLLRKFGHTIDQITRDGWRVDAKVKMQSGDDSPLDQAAGLSRGVAGIARFLEEDGTDMVLVLGDRIEAMAGALAATTTGRFVAHVHGGDIAPGDLDNVLRHAITKLSHVHLTATPAARRRVIAMGERREHVHFVGAPGLDRLAELIAQMPRTRRRSNRALVVHHSCGRSAAVERRVMSAALQAVEAEGLSRTVVYPNSDRGHTGIVKAIEAHRARAANGAVRVRRSLDHDTYLRSLIAADVLVGNSSSGIIEAATAGTASVNIGPRQKGRERSGRSVIDAGESVKSIRDALRRALRKRPIIGHATVYGDGTAGTRIADILASVPLDDTLRCKAGARHSERDAT